MDERRRQRSTFLMQSGWGAASAVAIPGDASARQYLRLTRAGDTAILMDAPGEAGATIPAFVRIANHLNALGLSAPRVLAMDRPSGFLLLEDFGDALFSALIDTDHHLHSQLYEAATDVLIALWDAPVLPGLVRLDPDEMVRIARMVADWYVPAIGGASAEPALVALHAAAIRLVTGPQVLMLRDYHAGNMIWLPARQGAARVGLLDFQDAMMAHPAYDLVSVLQDARRDVPAATEAAMIGRYCTATGQDRPAFEAAYALLGCQRALRILGVFARLCLHAAKPGYLKHAPRVWGQLQRNLAHPALSELAEVCQRLIPEPTPANLSRIKDQCGTNPAP